jgi:GNAT superfamily N-acetyltransferase
MTSTILIRQAMPADAAALARLNMLFNGGGMAPEQVADQLAGAVGVESAYLAEVDGAAVGFACLRLIPTIFAAAPYGEVTELFVEEAYRRLGIGRALLHRVETIARSAGVEELFLMTGFKNTTAHHFYHTIGYSLRCFTMFKALK